MCFLNIQRSTCVDDAVLLDVYTDSCAEVGHNIMFGICEIQQISTIFSLELLLKQQKTANSLCFFSRFYFRIAQIISTPRIGGVGFDLF